MVVGLAAGTAAVGVEGGGVDGDVTLLTCCCCCCCWSSLLEVGVRVADTTGVTVVPTGSGEASWLG